MMSKSSASTMTMNEIERLAPAAFALAPHASRSQRYSFLRTADVATALMGAGWMPVFAGQSRAKDLTRSGVQKHVIRFRHGDAGTIDRGSVVPELVLLNSHDGTSAYQLHAGLFRFVCGNGLVVADGTFAKVSIPHVGVNTDKVVEASFQVISEVPRLGESVEAMRSVSLSRPEQEAFAGAAARLRWEENAIPVTPAQLVTARRYEDDKSDLWTTFNAVQENLSRGGLRGKDANGQRRRTRGIASVTEDTKVNKALWHLAEEMRRIKSAA